MSAIETHNLSKKYGSFEVLQEINLNVAAGEVYGLLGNNGAGKSTLLHLLLGFLRPNGGEVKILGQLPREAIGQVGYLPERVRYHASFTAREYLHTLGRLSDLQGKALQERTEEVLKEVGLAEAAGRKLGQFSKGMLQRLGIAQALIHQPALLLLDEPSSGLDPAGQQGIVEILNRLKGQGRTILMCSHQLNEVESLCDRVGILYNGQLVGEARLDELLSGTSSGSLITVGHELSPALSQEILDLSAAISITGRVIRVQGSESLQQIVMRQLLAAGLNLTSVKPLVSGLADFYLRTTRTAAVPAAKAPALKGGVQ